MWKQVSVERYEEMLGVLPPRVMSGHGFLVGEAASHRTCKVSGLILPDYAAFVQIGGNYYEGPNMTTPEWRTLESQDVLESANAA